MMNLHRSILAFLVFLIVTEGASAQQQTLTWPEFGLDVGVAAPVGEVARHRTAGPALALSLGYRTTQRGLGLRGEVAWSRLAGGPPPPGSFSTSSHEDYDAYSVRGSLVYTLANHPRSVYAVVGAGRYRLEIRDDTNPYGSIHGLNVGFGIRFPAGPLHFNIEAQGVALLTDYGAGEFNWPVVHFPVTAGLRF